MSKHTLLASSPTLDGIRRIISDYYCGASVTLMIDDERPEIEVVTPSGKRDTIVIRKGGRYRFVMPAREGGAA